ncbi:cytokinin oxidase 5 [Arabidopsis thaliana]|uniref:cytokinin dehydrogenase n=2 Tax=Arabidopsis thaliana TaxID=3702 RepID=F4HZ40_ARATH|nr:cytokinin oxidase 5 [Arabidopsis thaliana]AEE35722.1 cytokinin oxidase 5 [Arabidopsis thaliana]|eukprot:NP_001185402.1 cytokinin oxidase 5 [Arabidopsis thaliana]
MTSSFLLLTFAICKLIIAVGLNVGPSELLRIGAIDVDGHFTVHPSDLASVSSDFGMLKSPEEPLAVLHPSSAEDVARLVRTAYGSATAFPVSARGHGHSINGQAAAGRNGVVVEMNHGVTGTPKPLVRPDEMYVDVWGGELWVDVLKKTLEHGLAPKSWTDYLYLTVGGTLSNAGISGQAFHHGPQISNVLELDVVTVGKGEVMRCSEEENTRLFHGVLGGLGQFGIITRARISLEPAPQRVRWIRVLYSSFKVFTEDQEYLISMHGQLKFDYVEGFVIVDEGLVNNWRSSFFSPRNPVKISSVSSNGSVLYCLEITKNYHDSDSEIVDQEVEILMKKLNFIPTSVFTTDLQYVDFLDRVHKAELKLRSKNLWEVPHPWLNLFVPKSRISDFDKGVFKGILGNKTSGPILIYPMNKDKWDERSSAVTPDEEVFYLVALLRSALTDGEETQKLEYLKDQNRRILEFCEQAKINVKQYLPHHATQEEWVAHFGDKWDRFRSLKAEFDPRHILATGQRIFQNPSLSLFPPSSSSSSAASW